MRSKVSLKHLYLCPHVDIVVSQLAVTLPQVPELGRRKAVGSVAQAAEMAGGHPEGGCGIDYPDLFYDIGQ